MRRLYIAGLKKSQRQCCDMLRQVRLRRCQGPNAPLLVNRSIVFDCFGEIDACVLRVSREQLALKVGAHTRPFEISPRCVTLQQFLRRQVGRRIQLTYDAIRGDRKELREDFSSSGGKQSDCCGRWAGGVGHRVQRRYAEARSL